jgi:hypothetical protein
VLLEILGSMLALTQNSVEGLGSGSPGSLLSATVLPAEKTRRATEKREDTVARPRWQQGWLFQRGKRTKKWIGRYREDVIGEDGQRRRRSRSVVLGPVREVSKRQAQRKLSDYLAAINQGTHKPEVMITFERFVLERFEPNILPTIRPSTRRLYRSLSRKHLLPFFWQDALVRSRSRRRADVLDGDFKEGGTPDGVVTAQSAVEDILRCGPLGLCSDEPRKRAPRFPS